MHTVDITAAFNDLPHVMINDRESFLDIETLESKND